MRINTQNYGDVTVIELQGEIATTGRFQPICI